MTTPLRRPALLAAVVLAAALALPVAPAAGAEPPQSRPSTMAPRADALERDLAQLARDLEREVGQIVREATRDSGRVSDEVAREMAAIGVEIARGASQAARDVSRTVGRDVSRAVGRDLGRTIGRSARELSREMTHYYEQRQGPESTERFSRTFKIGANGSIDLANVSGDITLTVTSGDEASIEAVKRVRATDAAVAKQALAEVEIEAVERGGRVEVRTLYPRSTDSRRQRHSGVSVDFTVRIPAGASASLKSVSGDVSATGVKGELRAESVSGEIVCDGPGRLALAKSVSGDVEITNAVSDANASVSSISGSITVKGLKARSIDIGSVSGDVRLWDVTTDRASVKSISGVIEYTGTLARNGRYEMSAHSGDVRLAIPDTVGFELEATTFSGSVRSDLPVTSRSSQSESRMRRSLRGTFGDGSATLDLSTFSGDIQIVQR